MFGLAPHMHAAQQRGKKARSCNGTSGNSTSSKITNNTQRPTKQTHTTRKQQTNIQPNNYQPTSSAPAIASNESADPLPPVPASCRGDRRGMQLEVIGIHDGPGGHAPKAQKVDCQDRSGSRTGPEKPVLGPVLGLVLLLLLVVTSPGQDRFQDWSNRSRIESWCDRWYRIPLQTAADTWCHLKPPDTCFLQCRCFRTGTRVRSWPQVPVTPCEPVEGHRRPCF